MGRMGDPGTIDKAWVENYKVASTQPQAIVALKWLGVTEGSGKSVGTEGLPLVVESPPIQSSKALRSSRRSKH
jgi:hypothetical protein